MDNFVKYPSRLSRMKFDFTLGYLYYYKKKPPDSAGHASK